jgi:beta-fructofuranosidase
MTSTMPHLHTLPRFHFKAPKGWLNDPCAPGYDVSTGTYHLFYQCQSGANCVPSILLTLVVGNPQSCDWGNITWGHLTSSDGLRWTQPNPEPVFKPDQAYDKEGVFTGCLWPYAPSGGAGLTVLYTSACYLPINWAIDYHRNSAGLAYATSTDGGKIWRKGNENPILLGEPEEVKVIGFRDPYVARWPGLDRIRNTDSLYGVISGGIRDSGGAVFLYEISPTNILEWKYLGPILQLPLRFKPSNQWDFGANWECAAFMTLSNENTSHDFFILGCEGAKKRDAASDINALVGYCLWMSGRLTKSDDPKMTYNFGGLLDHGCFYAPSQYEHPVSRKRILWGWIKEEDVTLAHCEEKGWRGMLSLPRELFLLSIPNVVGTLRTPLDQIDSIDTTADDAGLTSVHTMGVRPQGELRDLRARNPVSWSSSICEPIPFPLFQGPHWELEAVIAISAHDESKIGFSIQHNESRSKQTKIYFDTASEEIVVDRSTSNNDDKVIKDVLRGSFNLFKIRKEGKEETEKLFLRIFCDGNVVEVFANDRFAMSFMVYSDEPGCTALSYLADSSTSVLERFDVWELSKIMLD